MAGRSRDEIPVGMKFSTPIQTGPVAHQISYAMGTVSFLEVKQLGRDVDHPPPSAGVKGRIVLYFYSPSGSTLPVLG
jgi:hypothetical protein